MVGEKKINFKIEKCKQCLIQNNCIGGIDRVTCEEPLLLSDIPCIEIQTLFKIKELSEQDHIERLMDDSRKEWIRECFDVASFVITKEREGKGTLQYTVSIVEMTNFIEQQKDLQIWMLDNNEDIRKIAREVYEKRRDK